MKRISEKKLEAFAVGTMGKRQLSKRELEEQKKKEDEAAAAHVFKEFVETFQESPTPASKVWVKAGTYDAGSRREDNREKGKLYKPSSKLDEKSGTDKAQEYAKMLASDLKKDSLNLKKNKNQEKKKSNLELFKEELRQIQEEREERHKYKHMAGQQVAASTTTTENPPEGTRESGSFDTGDPNTTNLYLGNLSPKISEQQLMEIFGRYGPLASIKIMWPRSEEEKQRGRNCGFVAYMSRKDAERALRTLNGRYVMGYEMRLGWGKAVPVMNQPIFIPQAMLELTLPPPSSGLPFNAQPPASEMEKLPAKNYKEYTTPEEKENMEKVLSKSVVKVFIPTEKAVLNIIHRMIEFVIREGPMFEALVMSREMDNPLFSFLFDNESPAHIYYRWKLFSLLQGDTPADWNEKEFRMFKGGPIWKPPIANFYTQGMSDDLVVDPDAPEVIKGALSTAQRDRLEDLIRHLTPERTKIGDAMIFCIEHGDAADEICECISESLANTGTVPSKKIARLYLLSDILHNCTVKVANASFFRKSVEKNLVDVFEHLYTYHNAMESRLKAEGFKSRVMNVIRAWEEWAVYSKDFLTKLRYIFLGKMLQQSPARKQDESKDADLEDIDGAPISGDEKDDEDLDGVPLDGAALLKGALMRGLPEPIPMQKASKATKRDSDAEYNDDIDGVPLDEDIDGVPMEKFAANPKAGAFIPSKWETVDPEQVEAQAITTSKWETLDAPQPPKFYDDSASDDSNSQNFNEEKRQKLREIELKAMEYQDELEAGTRDLKFGWTIGEQVDHYRRKLLKSSLAELDGAESPTQSEQRRSESPDSGKRTRRNRRSSSPSQYQSNSSRSSPSRNSRKRSRSPYNMKAKSSRYESPGSTSSRSRRSPSPGYSSRSSKRDDYASSGSGRNSPARHRSDRHSKHKHKY